MINGTYQIVMKTLMGKKYGRLTLYENESRLSGDIHILGHDNIIHGDILNGRCQFIGELKTPMRNIAYWARGSVDEDKVDLVIHTDQYDMPLFGEIEKKTTEGGKE